MVELVGTSVVEVLTFQIDLGSAKFLGQPGGMIDRSRPALEVAADAAQFLDEIMRARDDLVGLADFGKRSFERGRDEHAPVGSEKSSGIR